MRRRQMDSRTMRGSAGAVAAEDEKRRDMAQAEDIGGSR